MVSKSSAVLGLGLNQKLENNIFATRVQNNSVCTRVKVPPSSHTVNRWLSAWVLEIPIMSSTSPSRMPSMCLGIVMCTLPFVL